MAAPPTPTLLQVASNPSYVNHAQASAFIVQQGDSLALLALALEKVAEGCLLSLLRRTAPRGDYGGPDDEPPYPLY